MDTRIVFLLLAIGLVAGLALSATWHYAKRRGYVEGYEQSKLEEEMKRQAAKRKQEQIESLCGLRVRMVVENATLPESDPIKWGENA